VFIITLRGKNRGRASKGREDLATMTNIKRERRDKSNVEPEETHRKIPLGSDCLSHSRIRRRRGDLKEGQ